MKPENVLVTCLRLSFCFLLLFGVGFPRGFLPYFMHIYKLYFARFFFFFFIEKWLPHLELFRENPMPFLLVVKLQNPYSFPIL